MEQHFQHEKTFRFEVLNEHSEATTVLYVLHGYGQLAKYFIRKFTQLPNNLLIVSPEGMHRFYRKGSSGRVGASWMTKEDRTYDIADTISCLNKVDAIISDQFPIEKRYLLGFSQGGAAAARWEELGEVSFDASILWASVFPPDLNVSVPKAKNQKKFFVLGDQDQFFSSDDQEKTVSFYEQMNYQIIRYKGDHDIVNETLTEIIRQIEAD